MLLLASATAQENAVQADAPAGIVRVISVENGPRKTDARTPRSHQAAGVLSYVHVAMQFDEMPLKQALRMFFRELGLDHAPYYRGNRSDTGMLSDVPITLEVQDLAANRALELILASAEVGEKYGWQLRGSIVEVGTLARLARSGEQRSHVYEIQDLTLDVPYFVPPGMDPSLKEERQTPRELAAQIMHHIMTSLHPDAWQPPTADDDDARPPPSLNDSLAPAWANLMTYDKYDNPLEIFVIGRWAKMHYHRKSLVVTAPDFIHRSLNGYPQATMPDPGKWKVPVVQPEKTPG